MEMKNIKVEMEVIKQEVFELRKEIGTLRGENDRLHAAFEQCDRTVITCSDDLHALQRSG